ncbi:hypothetical protein LCGC14_0473560 [marine sediment metagenome]|uniref:Uncharacterized protein n=1 Tax=marine sediment metagenome TaxID=412755 RepID=A0A0F9SBE3_9ZZZZ
MKGLYNMNSFSEKSNSTKGIRICSKRTICEVHRQIYDELVLGLSANDELLNKIVPLLEEAFGLGIKIVKKLLDTKCSLPNWEKNLSKEEVSRIRKLRRELEGEKCLREI